MAEAKDLNKYLLFESLDLGELESIKRFIFERTYKTGTTLFLEGMRGEVLYIIKSGRLDITKKSGSGEIVLASLGAGEFVGEMSIFDDEPRSATARAMEDTTVLLITKKCIQDILQAAPKAANKMLISILKIVNHRLRSANSKIAGI